MVSHSQYNASTVFDGLRDAVLVIPIVYVGIVAAFAVALRTVYTVYSEREAMLSSAPTRR